MFYTCVKDKKCPHFSDGLPHVPNLVLERSEHVDVLTNGDVYGYRKVKDDTLIGLNFGNAIHRRMTSRRISSVWFGNYPEDKPIS